MTMHGIQCTASPKINEDNLIKNYSWLEIIVRSFLTGGYGHSIAPIRI